MFVLRVCYKSGERFDEAYYKSTHLPLAARFFEPFGAKNGEMVRLTATPDGSPPPYQVIFSIYFDSAEQLQKALRSPGLAPVLTDIANYHDGMPDIMIGEVVPLAAGA